jgi:magnesium chelatase subunit I
MISFPFTAIVGMEDAKKSLIYHAIDPRIGGTLLLGHRGCAKSTLVRSFAEILQSISATPTPFVEVPLGTTEDRLLGSVNAEVLVEKRKWSERIGLLEEAHGGVLYIDEINLLPDHLADQILDSAASGRYRMERDGFTRSVESRYILVGTMNPDEGDLRPQLSDRFAHGVLIRDDFNPQQRVDIVKRRIAFDDEPEKFVSAFAPSIAELANRIIQARRRLTEVFLSDQQRLAVAATGRDLKLEGLRAELAVVRTARCAAALDDRLAVEEPDLQEAWRLCLGHRNAESSNSPQPPTSTSVTHPPAFGNRSTETSSAPRESRPDPRVLGFLQPDAHSQFLNWVGNSTANCRCGGERFTNHQALAQLRGPIAWLETVLCSISHGWLDGVTTIRLQHRVPVTRENFWCFLDASRSTGMNQFLDAARNILAAAPSRLKSARFHLVVLAAGEIQWATRRASATTFQSALESLREASGKSLIIEGLARLHRGKLRKGSSVKDRLVILSDGLASPASGENPTQSFARLRQILRRLTRSGTPCAWIHPEAKRGMRRWIPKLLQGLPFARFEV